MKESFPRENRLIKTDDFSSVFSMRPIRSRHFALFARKMNNRNSRLGIVVAKRFASRAVTRNMIKRLIREVFRHSRIESYDCIVRLSAPVAPKTFPATSSALKYRIHEELTALFSDLRSKTE